MLGGVFALLNAQLLSAGQPPLGFLNPALYGLFGGSSIGTDIVEGDNLHRPCPEGFTALPGWDAVTGLGTPLWTTLSELLAAKPDHPRQLPELL